MRYIITSRFGEHTTIQMQPTSQDRWRVTPVLACIIAFCLLNDLFVWPLFENGPQTVIILGLVLGCCFGQLNLISIWAAISPGSPIVRLPWAVLLVVLMWTAIVVGARVGPNEASDVVTLGIVLLSCCLIAQLPLWIASRVYGWTLIRVGSGSSHSAATGQFNLVEMFAATVLLAITLATLRVLLPPGLRDIQLSLDWHFAVLLPILIFVNLATVLPAIWAAFFLPIRAKALAFCAGACLIIAIVEVFLLLLLFGSGPALFELTIGFTAINAAQIGIVYFVLKLLHGVGFRLVRHELVT